jgi:hypothetical protein
MIGKLVYRRCCLTFDITTAHKVKELAAAQGQSVSSYIRYLIADAWHRAAASNEASLAANSAANRGTPS